LLDIANYCILTIMEIDKIKPVGAFLQRWWISYPPNG
jgi:hypothetical protein